MGGAGGLIESTAERCPRYIHSARFPRAREAWRRSRRHHLAAAMADWAGACYGEAADRPPDRANKVCPSAHEFIVVAADADETHPLMVSPHNWEVNRVGADLAQAMALLLRSASTILFVDRFFDIHDVRYKETLGACLNLIAANGSRGVRCEIQYGEHDKRPPAYLVEQNAGRWLAGVIPNGMSIALFGWKEKNGGADFHARYLLTDQGGMNVEAGFSAEGSHQKVQLALLDLALCQRKRDSFARGSAAYELIEPVLEIFSDGNVRKI
jgi:hypothetical protein